MMKKTFIEIKLDEEKIFSKLLLLTDTLLSVREKIKDKLNVLFLFLNREGNIINNNEEINICVNDIINEKIINIKSEEREIDIYLNNKYICSININYIEEKQNLEEFRKKLILKNEIINENSFFQDKQSDVIENKNEKNIFVKDIINKNKIKLVINKNKKLISTQYNYL